jgi:hypothetical protein
MIKAVMETISYHYKPKMFYKYETGEKGKKYYTNVIDIEKVIKIIPKVHGEIMYRTFGVLVGEKTLTVKGNTLMEDYEETTEDIDEETGEVFESQYFVTNPVNLYHRGINNEIVLKKNAEHRIRVLRARSGREAVQELNGIVDKKI